MRISIDASGLGSQKTGTVVYLTEILNVWNQDASVNHEFLIFAGRDAQEHLMPLGLDHRFRIVRAPNNRHLRSLWQQLILPVHIRARGIDVHWGPGFVLPLFSAVPMVLTVHDLTFQLFPEVHEWIKRYYFPAMINAAVKKAKSVIAISEVTRRDLYNWLPESRYKTHVTLLAARCIESSELSSEHTNSYANIQDYILFVGTVEPRKNLQALLDAWESLNPDVRGATNLIVVGARGWMIQKLSSRLRSIDSVICLGHVPDSELLEILKNAKAFVYPSLYEGFGLPVVEAMALGVPVLTSDIGATKEVSGGCARLVDPYSVDSIRDGLTDLLTDSRLRSSLSQGGLQRAAGFSWKWTATKTLELIESALS